MNTFHVGNTSFIRIKEDYGKGVIWRKKKIFPNNAIIEKRSVKLI